MHIEILTAGVPARFHKMRYEEVKKEYSYLIIRPITAAGFIAVLINVAPPAVTALFIVLGPVEVQHAAPLPEKVQLTGGPLFRRTFDVVF